MVTFLAHDSCDCVAEPGYRDTYQASDDEHAAYERFKKRKNRQRNKQTDKVQTSTSDNGGGRKPPKTAAAGDSPRLPGDDLTPEEQARMPRRLPPRKREPVTPKQLADGGLIGDGWEYLSNKETEIAEILQTYGVSVRSVADSSFATPDAITTDLVATIEFKTVTGKNGIRRGIRDARRQSRRVVVDARNSGTNRDTATIDLARALGAYGGDLDEVSILLPDKSMIRWSTP